jgi:UDP-N-acetylglucosamine--N-acetylmuramyl-(pentapeptide) pyrophosphoryl-undecaprenol N-acetylglucosamine transferase
MGEYPILGLPAILVPYPYAWKYQRQNADYLVNHGAAKLLADEELTQKLYSMITDLLNHPAILAEMKMNMLKLARPQAAVEIAQLITNSQWNKEPAS